MNRLAQHHLVFLYILSLLTIFAMVTKIYKEIGPLNINEKANIILLL